MFLQMELHTQATGAACYARIVAHDLVHHGILSEYIDSEAVSYTHLDVYKRQVLNSTVLSV